MDLRKLKLLTVGMLLLCACEAQFERRVEFRSTSEDSDELAETDSDRGAGLEVEPKKHVILQRLDDAFKNKLTEKHGNRDVVEAISISTTTLNGEPISQPEGVKELLVTIAIQGPVNVSSLEVLQIVDPGTPSETSHLIPNSKLHIETVDPIQNILKIKFMTRILNAAYVVIGGKTKSFKAITSKSVDFSWEWPSSSIVATEETLFRLKPNTLGAASFAFDLDSMSCDDTVWLLAITVNSETGELSGIPNNSTASSCTIVVKATSPTKILSQTLNVSVINTNDVPSWNATLSDVSLKLGESLTQVAVANDIDPNSTVTYSIDWGASSCDDGGWAPQVAIDPATGALSGSPSIADYGRCYLIIEATSGVDTIEQQLRISTYPQPLSGLCDTGTLADTCEITTTRDLSDDDWIGGPGNLIIRNGGMLRIATPLQRFFIFMGGAVTIEDGGRIESNVSLIGNTVTLASDGGNGGGIITATGKGFQGVIDALGNGPGGGSGHASRAGGGGAYGGAGGNSSANTPTLGGASYGSGAAHNPSFFGSAGGGGGGVAGSSGGGHIRIVAFESLTINGKISSDGDAVPNIWNGPGAGSGGSLWIETPQLTGTGALSVVGGSVATAAGGNRGGGGGGGRIGITVSLIYQFNGTISIVGGVGGGQRAVDGVEGTLRTNIENICDAGTVNDTCVITSTKILGDTYSLIGLGNLNVTSTGSLNVAQGLNKVYIQMAGDIVFASGSTNFINFELLSGENVTISSGATLNASGLGYPARHNHHGRGPGAGLNDESGGGAGHGNDGGGGSFNPATFGSAYGIKEAPTTFGSSGGAGNGPSSGAIGGSGGGHIKIIATDTLTIDGDLYASGTNSFNAWNGGGGGAGGSIWVSGDVVQGAGQLSVQGGDGIYPGGHGGGGGAGGRVAVDFVSNDSFTGFGTIDISGGVGLHSSALDGGEGTLCSNSSGPQCL